MRKILLITAYIFLMTPFSWAEKTYAFLDDKDNTPKNPIDILVQRLDNLKNLRAEDYLIDFKSVQAGDNFFEETTTYGGTTFFNAPSDKIDLITSINNFNTDANNVTNNVKLFVITGRYFMGYHEAYPPTDSEKQDTDIKNALNQLSEKLNESGNIENGEKFRRDWIEVLSNKFTIIKTKSTKVILFCYVEAVLADLNKVEIDYENKKSSKTFITGSNLTKKNIGFIWQNGLEVLEWSKLYQNQVAYDFFNKKLIRNPTQGLQNPSGIKECIDEIKRLFSLNIDLNNPDVVIKLIHSLREGDWSQFSVQSKSTFLTAIDNAFNNDCNKLDILYEKIPKYVIADVTDITLWKHLKSLLNCTVNTVGANEELAILNILEGFKNKQEVYSTFKNDPKLVTTIASKLGSYVFENTGESNAIFCEILKRLMETYGNVPSSPLQIPFFVKIGKASSFTRYNTICEMPYEIRGGKGYFSQIGFRDDGFIDITCFLYTDACYTINNSPLFIAKQNIAMNPLSPVRVYTQGEDSYKIYPAIYVHKMATDKAFDTFKQSALLSVQLLGYYGAAKVLLVEGGAILLRLGATIELAKAPLDLVMTDDFKKGLRDTGNPYAIWFADNWKEISTSVDIATLSPSILEAIYNLKNLRALGKFSSSQMDEIDKMADDAAKCLGRCFPAHTPIITKTGFKTIDNITVNDEVKAYDQTTKQYSWKRVLSKFVRQATVLASIYAGGNLVASATPNHLFYENSKKQYIAAENLKADDKLLVYQNLYAGNTNISVPNNEISIDSVVIKDTTLTVYNFEVEDLHNYLVGEQGILVHNDCPLVSFIAKLEALAEYTEVVNWLKRTDLPAIIKDKIVSGWDIKDLAILEKRFKSISALKTDLYDADALDLAYLLIKKSDESLDWASADYKYFKSLIEEAGDNYSAALQRLGNSQFFSKINTLGKGFEDVIITSFTDAAKISSTKKLFLDAGINLDDYVVFNQIQLKTGKKIKEIKNGIDVERDEYMIADFLLVKADKNTNGIITDIDFDNSIILEAKASRSTSLTDAQKSGLTLTGKGEMTVRSTIQESIYSPNNQIFRLPQTQIIKHQQFYKIWSVDGFGKAMDNLQNITRK